MRDSLVRLDGGGKVSPHYKFNLTNGSENLETMEYMKCGRVYHASRRGVVPTAILSGPIHILGSARAREPAGVEGAKMDPVRNTADHRGSEHTAKHTFSATRSHLRVDARFLSHSDRVVRNPSYGANHTLLYLSIW